MLAPAAVLVLVLLGAICVDSAVIVLAQRDLSNRTAAIANDAAALAVSDAAFYERTGSVALDESKADALVAVSFADDRRSGGFRSWAAEASVDGREVTVVATAEVGLIFASAIPGVAATTTVRARSVATATGG
jgi:hypothetical protein